MLSDTQIRSLKIEDGKRHADRDGLVLELRPSKKQLNSNNEFYFDQFTSILSAPNCKG